MFTEATGISIKKNIYVKFIYFNIFLFISRTPNNGAICVAYVSTVSSVVLLRLFSRDKIESILSKRVISSPKIFHSLLAPYRAIMLLSKAIDHAFVFGPDFDKVSLSQTIYINIS